jgi:hypothetical protein
VEKNGLTCQEKIAEISGARMNADFVPTEGVKVFERTAESSRMIVREKQKQKRER